MAALVLAAVPATPAAAAPHSTKHFTPARAAGRAAATTATALLSYSGGPVGLRPRAYLTFWGHEWTDGTFNSAPLESYLQSFFGGIGGSPWLGSAGEYCQGVAVGSTSCPFGWAPIPNPAG